MHLISALAFELDHCDEPVVDNRMTERLCDIDLELAQAVAEKAGAPMDCPPWWLTRGTKRLSQRMRTTCGVEGHGLRYIAERQKWIRGNNMQEKLYSCFHV